MPNGGPLENRHKLVLIKFRFWTCLGFFLVSFDFFIKSLSQSYTIVITFRFLSYVTVWSRIGIFEFRKSSVEHTTKKSFLTFTHFMLIPFKELFPNVNFLVRFFNQFTPIKLTTRVTRKRPLEVEKKWKYLGRNQSKNKEHRINFNSCLKKRRSVCTER